MLLDRKGHRCEVKSASYLGQQMVADNAGGTLDPAGSAPDGSEAIRAGNTAGSPFGPTAAADSFEAWRENPHDDLVLAIAIAAWIGERAMRRFWIEVIPNTW